MIDVDIPRMSNRYIYKVSIILKTLLSMYLIYVIQRIKFPNQKKKKEKILPKIILDFLKYITFIA